MKRKIILDVAKLKREIGFCRDEIQHDLSPFYKQIYSGNSDVEGIYKEWGSVENYVDCLYWMKFVKKMNPTQIKEATGGISLYRPYQSIGWNYSTFDFDECNLKHKEKLQYLDEIRNNYNFDDPIFESEEFVERTRDSRGKMTKHSLQYYGGISEEELIRILYYYLYKHELGTFEIAYLMDRSQRSVENLIKQLDLDISKSEVQKRAARKRDYSRIEATRRLYVFNTSIKDAAFGSHAENVIRTFLATKLENILVSDYEVIVGLNTRTIISPLEIDIPIVLIHKTTGNIFKVAVEVDGEKYHSGTDHEAKDDTKNEIASQNGWKMVRLPIPIGMDVENEIELVIDSAVEEISNYINANNKLDEASNSSADETTASESKKCPQCQGVMIMRVASKGAYIGNRFWGCSNFPNCKYIENIYDK